MLLSSQNEENISHLKFELNKIQLLYLEIFNYLDELNSEVTNKFENDKFNKL
jgi:hypothetical protein